MSSDPVAVRRIGRRIAVGITVIATLLTSACAAGRHAATAQERTTFDGANANLGGMALRGLSIQSPPAGSTPYYPAGSNAPLRLVLVNNSTGSTAKPDQLVSISTPVASRWAIFATAQEAQAPGGSGVQQSVPIQPGQRVSWGVPEAEGALELIDLKKQLFPGSTVPITFQFANAGKITVDVPVRLSSSPASSVVPEPSQAG